MYPYGSGMPQGGPPYPSEPFGAGRWPPPSQAPHSQPQPDAPIVPFGAGRWVDPNQTAYPPQQSPYPSHPNYSQAPYPSSTPYSSSYAPSQPSYSASSQASYPVSSQPPYPPSSQPSYPPSSQPSYPPSSQPSYPPSSQSPYSASSQAPYPVGNAYPPQSSPYPPAGNQYQQCPYPPKSTNTPSQAYSPYSHAPYPSGNPHNSGPYNVVQIGTCAQAPSGRQLQKGTPTVVPTDSFDPVGDAHALRKAMRGFGTDEDTLINIICRRSNAQRQEIQRQYKTHFGKDLIEDIISETSGNFQKLLVGLLLPIVDFYVRELNDAMAGLGTDEDVLIEVLCTLSNAEIHTIKHAYRTTYGRDLESDLVSETSGNFKRLLVSLCAGARDESGQTDMGKAQQDARELLNAGELRFGTDESTFNMVLCQRNFQQLRLIFQEYQNITGHALEKAIKREFSGDIEEGLLAIYKCVMDKAEFFAKRLHKSMAGIGTNDQQLIRVIITRCEIDMQDIKTTFERIYGKSLKSWIKGDTSGHYKHALYALIGEERSK